MSKGLEALERIVVTLTVCKKLYLNKSAVEEIEKELKERDELAQALSIVTCENGNLLKYKQALEIIKEKKVNCYLIIGSENLEDYNGCVDDITEKRLTEEEYDLLKEALS